jgi:hypothetical protein
MSFVIVSRSNYRPLRKSIVEAILRVHLGLNVLQPENIGVLPTAPPV